jgi:hypothetical protein
MLKINYHQKIFQSRQNSASGEVDSQTLFYYFQKNDLVWANYEGGEIVFGTLIAKVLADGKLDMRYQHLNKKGELMTGICASSPEILPDGRIRLYEKWQWTSGNFTSGESIIEEIEKL